MAVEIEKAQGTRAVQSLEITLAKLEAIVIGQIIIADDALEDWKDIVPEEVEELSERLVSQRSGRSYNE